MADVSVIIPVFNDPGRLKRCVKALEGSAVDAEIIVVDNGSDGDLRIRPGDFDGVRVGRQGLPGSYAARNHGIAMSSAPILAFTDADCIPAPGWLESGVEAISSPGVDMAGGAVHVFPADPNHPRAAELYDMTHGFPQQGYVEEMGFAATANLFVSRQVFDGVGLFREDLLSGGDREFGQRAAAAGYHITYAGDAVVEHPARSSFAEHGAKVRRVVAGTRDLADLGGDVDPTLFERPWRRFVPPLRAVFRGYSDQSLDRTSWRIRHAYAVAVMHYVRAAAFLRVSRGAVTPRS